MKTSSRAVWVLCVLTALALAVTSCSQPLSGSNSGADNATIRFTLDESLAAAPIAALTSTARGVSTPIGLYLLYAEYPFATDSSPSIHLVPVSAGSQDIEVQKDAAIVMTLAQKTAQGITVDGTIRCLSNLDSIPVSSLADNTIDLGTVSYDSQTGLYSSNVDAATLSAELGYDAGTLLSFGAYDDVLMASRNPDIDGDGTFDVEQGLRWTLTPLMYTIFNEGDYDIASGALSPGFAPALTGFKYVFAINRDFGYPIRSTNASDYSDITMAYSDGSTPESYTTSWLNAVPPDLVQAYFDVTATPDTYPRNGSFTVTYGSQAPYTVGDARFLAAASQYNGMAFPIFGLTWNGSRLSSIAWKWMIVDGGAIRAATMDEVRMRAKSMFFSFEIAGSPGVPVLVAPAAMGKNYWEDGSVSVASTQFDALTTDNIAQCFCDVTDIADEYMKIELQSPSLP